MLTLPEVEGFKILKPIHIKIEGAYIASVCETNLIAGGNTKAEAVANLGNIIASTYKLLKNHPNLRREALELLEFLNSHLMEFSKDDEIKQLRKQVANLQLCVYCGHKCSPGADVLTHIEECSEHPLAVAKREIERLQYLVDNAVYFKGVKEYEHCTKRATRLSGNNVSN